MTQSNAIILHAAHHVPRALLPHADAQSLALIYERFFFFVTDVIAISHGAFFMNNVGATEASQRVDVNFLEALTAADDFVKASLSWVETLFQLPTY